VTCSLDALLKIVSMAAKHQLKELSDGFGILPDLFFCPGIEYGETGVNMPFVGVDTQHNVALDIFDASNVTVDLPGKLIVREPGGAHTQECSVGYSLRVCRDPVMFLGCKTHVIRAKARKDLLDRFEALLRCSFPDKNKGLAFGIDSGSMQRMARYDLDVFRKMLSERGNFDLFAGGLAANNRTLLGSCSMSAPHQPNQGSIYKRHTRPTLAHDTVNGRSFYTIEDKIA